MLTVLHIVTEWLRSHGYDGLVADGGECGCDIDNLIPCDAPCETCRAGFKGPDPDGDCDYLIYPTREAAEAAKEPDSD